MKWLDIEQKFILSFLRYSLGHESPEDTVRLASGPLNWEKVAAMAEHHGISSILHNSLAENSPVKVPDSIIARLAKTNLDNLAVGLLCEKELKDLFDKLKENKISFVLHKGFGLAVLLYPRPELRPCGVDFDILIQKHDYSAAKALLNDMGYGLDYTTYENVEISCTGEVRYIKNVKGRNLVVDLHTDFIANAWGKVTRFDKEGFWKNLPKVKYHTLHIPHLPVDVYLFFLSIHCAAAHIFDRLINFCDLDLFIRKYRDSIDWKDMGEQISKTGSKKVIYHALNYCRILLQTPVPEDFLREIEPTSLSKWFIPEKRLLLRESTPPKNLKRYMHVVLLDNPLLVFKSMILFSRRFFSERFNRIREGYSA